MPTYSLIATKCPALPARTSAINPSMATPLTGPDETGQSTVSKARINWISAKIEASVAIGAYAVAYGLDLSDGGTLTANVSAGMAALDGPVVTTATSTVSLADNAYNWIYLLQSGVPAKTSSATDTPPAAPASACAFLGRIQVTAGVQSTPDYSGRLSCLGGTLVRRTGDAGAPADTPPAGYFLHTITAGGVYQWDGVAHRKGLNSGSVTSAELASGAVSPSALAASTLALIAGTPTVTPGTQTSHSLPVTVQLKDAGGANVAAQRLVRIWLADSALGTETATAPDGGATITTGAVLETRTTNKRWEVITNSSGAAVVTLTHSVAGTWHVAAECGGRLGDGTATLT